MTDRLWIDPDGNAFAREPVPVGADVWDLYGTADTRYVFLIVGGTPAPYETRSLPWMENPASYRQVMVTGNVGDLRRAYADSTDESLKQKIDDMLAISHFSWETPIYRGIIAPAFGDPGGATGLTLPLPLGRSRVR